MSRVHVHDGPAPQARRGARVRRPPEGIPLALPLSNVLNYLLDRPPWCCFATDSAQVCLHHHPPCCTHEVPLNEVYKILIYNSLCLSMGPVQERALKGYAERQARRSRAGASQEAGKAGSDGHDCTGTLPVFRIPGLAIILPSSIGPIRFTPLFLSSDQLQKTWVIPPFSSPKRVPLLCCTGSKQVINPASGLH
jgi:hypothetical protein